MRERARLVGGKFALGDAQGGGTELTSTFPLGALAVTVPLKTRILLADDHAVVRDGLHMVLDSQPDLEVVAEAGDGAEALSLGLDEIDLAVLDVSMPRMTGLQAARELSRRAARAAHRDAVDARQGAVLLRGPEGRRRRLRAEVRSQP